MPQGNALPDMSKLGVLIIEEFS